MKKISILSLLFFTLPARAIIVSDGTNICGVYAYDKIYATYEVIQYTCSNGQFLPANAIACATCPDDYSCSGGTFGFNANKNQGLSNQTFFTHDLTNMCATNAPHNLIARYEPLSYTCSSGQYLPANAIACTVCLAGNACIGGTYSFNETIDQGIQSCASGTYSPSGSAVCYPHILHVGDNNVYLKSTKQTTPSLNIKIGNDIFYAHMTTVPTKMNKDSTRYFRVQWPNNDYYVCDDTTCPQ